MKNKLLSIGGSNSKNSISRAFANTVSKEISDNYELIDLNDYEVDIYSIDREIENGIPEKIINLYEKISESDIVLISYAEHNGTYTVAFKNVLDWLSRIEVGFLQGKKTILLSSSIGATGGESVLSQGVASMVFLNGTMICAYSLGSQSEDMIKDGNLVIDSKTKKELVENIKSKI